MLKVTVDDVIDKLTEYGMALYNDYATEDQGHCFMTEKMIIFLDEEDDSISITFQADTKPEDVASNILILKEIENVSQFFVMESFIYDKNHNFVSGSQAHKIVRESFIESAFRKAAEQQTYSEILNQVKGYEC